MEFFVCGFEFLDRRLQSFFGFLQLTLDLPDEGILVSRPPRAGRILLGSYRSTVGEHDAVGCLVSLGNRLYRDRDGLYPAIDLHLYSIADDPVSRVFRLLEGGAQIGPQSRARHRDDVAVRRAGGWLQVFSGTR